MTSQSILECCALQLLLYAHTSCLKRHLCYIWTCIYLQDISELSHLAGYLFEWSIWSSSLALAVFCLRDLWSWSATSEKQSYLLRKRWLIAHFSKCLSYVCFLVKSHPQKIIFNIYLDSSSYSIRLFCLLREKRGLLQWFKYCDKPSANLYLVVICSVLLRKHLKKLFFYGFWEGL